MSSQHAKSSRSRAACVECRSKKQRCDGPSRIPCRRCELYGVECIYEQPLPALSPNGTAAAPMAGPAFPNRQRQPDQSLPNKSQATIAPSSVASGVASSRTAVPDVLAQHLMEISERLRTIESSLASRPNPQQYHNPYLPEIPSYRAHSSNSNSSTGADYPGFSPSNPSKHVHEPGGRDNRAFDDHRMEDVTPPKALGSRSAELAKGDLANPYETVHAAVKRLDALVAGSGSSDHVGTNGLKAENDGSREGKAGAYKRSSGTKRKSLSPDGDDRGQETVGDGGAEGFVDQILNPKVDGGSYDPMTEGPPRALEKEMEEDMNRKKIKAGPDAITRGIITATEAQDLFDIVFDHCEKWCPLFSAMDQIALNVRTRSSLLFHSILTVGAYYKLSTGGSIAIAKYCGLVTLLNELFAPRMICPTASDLTIDFLISLLLLILFKPPRLEFLEVSDDPKNPYTISPENHMKMKFNSIMPWVLLGTCIRVARFLRLEELFIATSRGTSNFPGSESEVSPRVAHHCRVWLALCCIDGHAAATAGRPSLIDASEMLRASRLYAKRKGLGSRDVYNVALMELLVVGRDAINPKVGVFSRSSVHSRGGVPMSDAGSSSSNGPGEGEGGDRRRLNLAALRHANNSLDKWYDYWLPVLEDVARKDALFPGRPVSGAAAAKGAGEAKTDQFNQPISPRTSMAALLVNFWYPWTRLCINRHVYQPNRALGNGRVPGLVHRGDPSRTPGLPPGSLPLQHPTSSNTERGHEGPSAPIKLTVEEWAFLDLAVDAAQALLFNLSKESRPRRQGAFGESDARGSEDGPEDMKKIDPDEGILRQSRWDETGIAGHRVSLQPDEELVERHRFASDVTLGVVLPFAAIFFAKLTNEGYINCEMSLMIDNLRNYLHNPRPGRRLVVNTKVFRIVEFCSVFLDRAAPHPDHPCRKQANVLRQILQIRIKYDEEVPKGLEGKICHPPPPAKVVEGDDDASDAEHVDPKANEIPFQLGGLAPFSSATPSMSIVSNPPWQPTRLQGQGSAAFGFPNGSGPTNPSQPMSMAYSSAAPPMVAPAGQVLNSDTADWLNFVAQTSLPQLQPDDTSSASESSSTPNAFPVLSDQDFAFGGLGFDTSKQFENMDHVSPDDMMSIDWTALELPDIQQVPRFQNVHYPIDMGKISDGGFVFS